MPFTMPNFPILTFEQANPMLAGMKYGAGIGQDLLNAFRTNLLNQELQAKMPYVGSKEREALKHAQLMNTYQGLVNKFTPEDYQTTFASRRASAQSSSAQAEKATLLAKMFTDMLKQQSSGQSLPGNTEAFSGTQSQVRQPNLESTLSTPELNFPTLGSRQKSSRNIFNGESPELKDSLTRTLQAQSQIQRMEPQAMQQQPGMGAPMQPQMQQPGQPQMAQQNMQMGQGAIPNPLQPSQSKFTYPQAAAMMAYAGLGKPEITEIAGTGTKVAITPWGSIPVAQGLSAYEEGKAKGMGKFAAENYQENFESFKSLQNQDLALDTMIDVVNNNPEFKNATGPVGGLLASWGAATPEQQKVYGTLASASGQIKLLIAPGLKGAFTGKDQTMINEIKANPSDPKDVFVGKLKAMKLIGTVLQKRTELSMQYQDQGMSPLQAIKRATKETPLEKYRPIVDKMIKPLNEKGKKGFKTLRRGNENFQIPESEVDEALKEGFSYA